MSLTLEINHEIIDLFHQIFKDDTFIKLIMSTPFKKSSPYFKIQIAVIYEKQKFFQITYYFETKVKHKNIFSVEEIISETIQLLSGGYKNCNIICSVYEYIIMISKNGNSRIKKVSRKLGSSDNNCIGHNNVKIYILKEGTSIPWLYKLGIINKDGFVLANKQKKFRQINRFLEMIDDISSSIPHNAQIVDVGCGKSYLTFALYYYLNEMLGKKVSIIGLDLKTDVVQNCQSLADSFGFKNLSFKAGDIANFTHPSGKVDMVITLHACDTATDYALFNAIKWGAKVILSVPCCQHELFDQIKNDTLKPLLKHGILKERFSALLTDTIRGLLLEAMGYKCTIMEFIDTEHTPKNIMIRGIKTNNLTLKKASLEEFNKIKNDYNITHTLYKLLEGYF